MNFSVKKYSIIFFIALMPFFVLAQNNSNKVVRAEIETTENAKPFNIVNLGKNGILILTKLNEYLDRKTQNWSFTLYNNVLQKKWTKKLPLSEDLSYQGYGFEKDTAYLFFYKEDKRSTENNFKIIAFELSKGNSNQIDTLVTDKAKLSTLQIYQQNAYFTIENKSKICLGISSLSQRLYKEILIDNTEKTNVENLKIDSINKVIYLLIKKTKNF